MAVETADGKPFPSVVDVKAGVVTAAIPRRFADAAEIGLAIRGGGGRSAMVRMQIEGGAPDPAPAADGAIEIEAWGPPRFERGQVAKGAAAVWFKLDAARPGMIVEVEGENPLRSAVDVAGGVVTANIPTSFARPGRISLNIRDTPSGRTSKTVHLEIGN